MILMRTLRKDYARYSKDDDIDDMVSLRRTSSYNVRPVLRSPFESRSQFGCSVVVQTLPPLVCVRQVLLTYLIGRLRCRPLYNVCVPPSFQMSNEVTEEIVYNEHEDQAEFARYNRFSL